MLGRLHQTEMFFGNKAKQKAGRKGASDPSDKDHVSRLFGTAVPADIPESTEWWKRQTRDLFAMSDEAELDLMQAMVTVTANDSCPEMLAAIRRGPLAAPTAEENIEYLLTRKRRDQERPPFENHSFEHVLSFQRRVSALKSNFMQRGALTPLGRVSDWWDRTEAQMRAALHAHILTWFQRRQEPDGYTPLGAVERTVQGDHPKQRDRRQIVEPIRPYQEDNLYHRAKIGRVMTEMVRPQVCNAPDYGGFDFESLRIAGLARHIQSQLYLHRCTPNYCLQGRTSCRFFFPWPCQPQQQYDKNCERVAGQRRLEADDQWLNPHNIALAMFSPATVHVLPFDPCHGADTARQYATKYAGKPEKWYFLEGDRSGVKEFLKCRTVGLCMAHNRLLNFHVVRSTRPVQYTPTTFIPPAGSRTPREPSHIARLPQYPDTKYYLTLAGKYFFRNASLRSMRLEQFNRYFCMCSDSGTAVGQTMEDTAGDEGDPVDADVAHRHFHYFAQSVAAGNRFLSTADGVCAVRKRMPARLAVSRVPFIEPIGDKREAFYEQRLLLGLPWYCAELPTVEDDVLVWRFTWTPPSDKELGDVHLEPRVFEIGATPISFERLCADIEKDLCQERLGLVCLCCAGKHKEKICRACQHAVGFHMCQHLQTEGDGPLYKWRKGTLFADKLDGERVLFNLHRKGIPIEPLRKKADEYEEAGIIAPGRALLVSKLIEEERGKSRIANDPTGATEGSNGQPDAAKASVTLGVDELAQELARREKCLQAGAPQGGVTDQWRVYCDITEQLSSGQPCRMMVQASAGTGLLFVLTCTW